MSKLKENTSIDLEEMIMNLIIYSGEARSSAMEAIYYAKKNDFLNAEKSISDSNEKIAKAHKFQTQLIQKEAGGNKIPVSLLLVHAQDHLMNAITVKDLAFEIVEIYFKK